MHYEILMSERELPIEESSEISDTKKLISMNNNQMTNNGEDICIDIQGRLHDKNFLFETVLMQLSTSLMGNAFFLKISFK